MNLPKLIYSMIALLCVVNAQAPRALAQNAGIQPRNSFFFHGFLAGTFADVTVQKQEDEDQLLANLKVGVQFVRVLDVMSIMGGYGGGGQLVGDTKYSYAGPLAEVVLAPSLPVHVSGSVLWANLGNQGLTDKQRELVSKKFVPVTSLEYQGTLAVNVSTGISLIAVGGQRKIEASNHMIADEIDRTVTFFGLGVRGLTY
jgi:hypothetical protein